MVLCGHRIRRVVGWCHELASNLTNSENSQISSAIIDHAPWKKRNMHEPHCCSDDVRQFSRERWTVRRSHSSITVVLPLSTSFACSLRLTISLAKWSLSSIVHGFLDRKGLKKASSSIWILTVTVSSENWPMIGKSLRSQLQELSWGTRAMTDLLKSWSSKNHKVFPNFFMKRTALPKAVLFLLLLLNLSSFKMKGEPCSIT